MGCRLLGSAHQCRHLRAQPRQQRRGQVQAAGLAQCLGHPRAHPAGRCRRARARQRQAGRDVPATAGRFSEDQPLHHAVPADRGGGHARQRDWPEAGRHLRHHLLRRREQALNAPGPLSGGDRHHLPGPAGGHLLHRAGDADRPGDRHRG